MKLTYSFLLVITIFCTNIYHIKGENNYNEISTQKNEKNNLYKNVEFLDTRPLNEFNSVKIDGKVFQEDLQFFINKKVNNSTLNKTMLVNLRHCNIYFDKKKDCYIGHLRISLFDHILDNYCLISTFDDMFEISKDQNPNKFVSDVIYKYIADNLSTKLIDTTPYLIADIRNFETMEKLRMPLFSNGMLTDGIYLNYSDFRDQYPLSDKLSVDIVDGELYNVKAINIDKNKSISIKPEEVYSIVYNGQAYIAIDNQFVPLYLENNNFWFKIKSNDKIKGKKDIQPKILIYKVDHLNGMPIKTSIK